MRQMLTQIKTKYKLVLFSNMLYINSLAIVKTKSKTAINLTQTKEVL